MKISLWLQILSIISVLVLHCVFDFRASWLHFLSGCVFGAVYLLATKVTAGKFGMGDVLFGIFQGCCLDLVALPVVLVVEAAVGAVVFAVAGMVSRGKGAQTKVPFVPVMGVALVVSYLI